MPSMHTFPAAKLVGHDFLGNHIGELLFRQPVSKASATDRTKGSSNGSTVCPSEHRTVRRGSVALQNPDLIALCTGALVDAKDAQPQLHPSLGVGIESSSQPPTHRVSSPDQSSGSSLSEPDSVESRSGSADADVTLHLSQLSLARRRIASEGVPTSPRISFVTNFGAKTRSSGSQRAPSEAGSSSYFGLSSNLSVPSMSPMEFPGAINWNIPFREQNQFFANAIEQNALLNRKSSQQSQSSDAASSQPSKRIACGQSDSPEMATPTTSAESVVVSEKSHSFSQPDRPVRQRFTRAATESSLKPIVQSQQTQHPQSPNEPTNLSKTGLAPSKSMGSASSGLLVHRKKPSLVPKGDDERTFCFVDNGHTGAAQPVVPLAEDPLPASTLLASVPERSVSQSSSMSSSKTSYREIVQGQYAAALSAGSGSSRLAASASAKTKPIAKPRNRMSALGYVNVSSTTLSSSHATAKSQNSAQISLLSLKPPVSTAQNGSSRPKRRLRIQPNVQSRPSLLEKTMEQQKQARQIAIAANAKNDAAEDESPAATASVNERYKPIVYGTEQRIFRIQSGASTTDGVGFPFTVMSGDVRDKASESTEPAASHARTSDWAREQSMWTSSPAAGGEIESSCNALLTLGGSVSMANGHAAQRLLCHHTASHSSSSTESASTNELLSPPETAISTPELESAHEREPMLSHQLALGPLKPLPARRSSPLSA